MSFVREGSKRVTVVTCGDLHLWHKAPVARTDVDWLATQMGYLQQLKRLVFSLGNPVVIYAGDIFDRWNPSLQAVNTALSCMPQGYAICGQHDLPMHSYADIQKTAYWTLVEAGKIVHVDQGAGSPTVGDRRIHGFPWGVEVVPLEDPHDLLLEVAVIHAYVWTKDHCYPGAPSEKRLGAYKEKLRGYDVAVFGDNHKGFVVQGKEGRCSVINGGCFIRRKQDERSYKPFVGLVYEDGSVGRHYLDTSGDQFLDMGEGSEEAVELLGGTEFLEELANLGECALNFAEVMQRRMDDRKVPDQVREATLRAMGGGTD